MPASPKAPPLKVAIVGRPNVGKSTLFNRLAGKKLAIVDDRPGVTRDRRYALGRLGDLDLQLIDTAGFEDLADESLEARMRRQTELAVDEADLVLFVLDAREGVTPLDRIFADLVRRRDKPTVVIANKAEGRAGEVGAAEAHGLGLGEPIQLSAEHGEGLADLYAELVAYAPEPVEDAAEETAEAAEGEDGEDGEEGEVAAADAPPIRIAIMGRPNAGKSTLINRLLGEDRMLTGPEAGITRDAVSVEWAWEGRRVRLVDTAGMRRKARVQEKLERLSVQDAIRAMTFAEVVVLVMDADNAFETQDLQIADLIEREGRAVVFCITKWDLVKDQPTRLKAMQETAERMLPQLRGAPLVALSGVTGKGLDRLMPAVIKTHRNWSAKVKTRDLNDWLAMAVQRHPPPAVDGRRIKPKYMAQTKARPPTFVLFASRAAHLPDSYRRYLINSLRESFDLPGVPIRITIKSGANPYAEGGEGGRQRPGLRKPARPPARRTPPRSSAK
jgi:GTP-binding protein